MSTKFQLLSSLFRICMLLLLLTEKGHTINPYWHMNFFPSTTVCNSKECEQHGKRLAELINFSVDPCDDFYEFVCGRWGEKNPLPPNVDEWSVDSKLQLQTFERVKEMLEEPIMQNDTVDIISAKTYHMECMKTPYFDVVEPSVVRNNVNPIGYFPLVNKYRTKNKKTWQLVHNYYLSFTGESGLFSLFWRVDRRNNNAPLLCFRETLSPFGLINGFVPTESQMGSYLHFLMALVKDVMLPEVDNVSQLHLEREISAVITFRQTLYKAMQQTSGTSDIYNPITVEALNNRYKKLIKKEKSTAQIDWIEVIHHFYGFREKSRYVIKSMLINVQNRMYLQSLAGLLSKTPEDVIVNHVHLYFIERHTILSPRLRNLLLNSIIENGKLKGKIRYLDNNMERCISMNEMKESIGKYYVRRYFPPDIEKEAGKLAKELKEMLITQIQESTWLSRPLMEILIDRVVNMHIVMGYPEYYKDGRKKFENPAAAAMEPIKLEAFYLPLSNTLSISAAYLNPPIYGSSLPYAMIYSGLGEYIAHEMYHGFGPNAIDYLQKRDQWPQHMKNLYDKKMMCFVNKFDKITVKELKNIYPTPQIDGLKTLEENVSDLMGLKLSYWAFRKKVWETKKCEVLPHMFSFTCDHLFFISFASLYCTTLTLDAYMMQLKNGAHCTPRLRVNEATSNFHIFNKIFRCTKFKDISQLKTCDLWK